jgi:hypothetical protein
MVSIKQSKNGVQPFRIERRQAKLVFQDSGYSGLEIIAKLDVSVAVYLEMQNMTATENAMEMRDALKKFGDDILISWNLEDEDGSEVTPNADGFMTLPPKIAVDVMKAWSDACGGVGEA